MKHLRTKSELLAAADAGNWIAASFKAMMAAPAEETPPPVSHKPPRVSVVWTPEKDQMIRDGIAAGESCAAIAERIGVKASTTRDRAYFIGLRFTDRESRPYTAEDDAFMRQAVEDGKTCSETARAMGRPVKLVHARARRMGLMFPLPGRAK